MNIIELEASQKKRAAEVATEAFFYYPMMNHYFPDLKRRKRWLPWYLEKTLTCAMHFGKVFTTSDCSGVMFILPPEHTRLTDIEYIQNGFLFVPFIMGFRNYMKSSKCEKFVADTHEQLLKGQKHYYLWGLVVDPKAQGEGVGGTLLKKLTDTADAEELPVYLETHEQKNVAYKRVAPQHPVYLETHEQKNVAYYERFGFKLIHTGKIHNQGIEIWCMLREVKN